MMRTHPSGSRPCGRGGDLGDPSYPGHCVRTDTYGVLVMSVSFALSYSSLISTVVRSGGRSIIEAAMEDR